MFIRVFRFSWLLRNTQACRRRETASKSLFPEMSDCVKRGLDLASKSYKNNLYCDETVMSHSSSRVVASERDARCLARSFAARSHRLANSNSTARIASPVGITTTAGPGVTIITTPTANTVPPMIPVAMRRSTRTVPFSGSVGWWTGGLPGVSGLRGVWQPWLASGFRRS